jgi:nitroreductase/ferredoxin
LPKGLYRYNGIEKEREDMVQIDKEKCTGCGLCVRDCIQRHIQVFSGKAEVKGSACILCGHCVAICPRNAVSIDNYNMDEVSSLPKREFQILPEKLFHFMKDRRSIRRFTQEPITREDLDMILETGRYTPTGGNAQTTKFLVLEQRLDEVREKAIQVLYETAIAQRSEKRPYRDMFVRVHKEYQESGKDGLFYHGQVVIIILDKKNSNNVNAALAASRMELMAVSLGLGACFIGFLGRAAEVSEELRKMLEIGEDYQIATTLTLGYPAVKYQRTAPRAAAEVKWM